jgi:hypothetical protein
MSSDATVVSKAAHQEVRRLSEEQAWFPEVGAGLGREQLREIGAEIEQARGKAPRKPMRPDARKQPVDAAICWPASRPGCRTATSSGVRQP